jgi:hypothetical protein
MPDATHHREIARCCRKLLKEAAGTATPELLHQLKEWALECDESADRSSFDSEPLEQARRHRARAEEYRAVAEQLHDPTAIASYRRLAETYEAMARKLEEPAPRTEGRETG